jgi:serine phosphatase RsbU (regulator of sigma subunit)
VLTGFARDSLRATTVRDDDPVASLVQLNDLLRERSNDRFVTVAHLVIDRDGERSVEVALGGHPHPLLVRRGEVTRLGSPGSLLGVHRQVRIDAHRYMLEPGDLLVAYTDGLTDQAHAPMPDDELHGLVRAMGAGSADEAVELVRTHLRRQRSERTADDTLVVVVQVERS